MNRLSLDDSVALSNLLMKKIALDWEAKDHSEMRKSLKLMEEMPMEAIIISMRNYISPAKLANGNLDKNKEFSRFWKNVSQRILK